MTDSESVSADVGGDGAGGDGVSSDTFGGDGASGDDISSARISAQARELVATLAFYRKTVSAAESLTGGLVCAALTDVPGASAVFRGGIVAYATDTKAQLLGVDSDLLAAQGAVDDEVAAEMVTGVVHSFNSDFGVAVTGVAGPDPQDDQPVGRVIIATWANAHIVVENFMFEGDRDGIRQRAVSACLDAVAAAVGAWAESEYGPGSDLNSV